MKQHANVYSPGATLLPDRYDEFVRVKRNVRQTFSEVQKRLIAGRQGYMCRGDLCQGRVPLTSCWQLDHVTPLFLGGSNLTTNLMVLCAECHALKTQKEKVDFYFRQRLARAGQMTFAPLCSVVVESASSPSPLNGALLHDAAPDLSWVLPVSTDASRPPSADAAPVRPQVRPAATKSDSCRRRKVRNGCIRYHRQSRRWHIKYWGGLKWQERTLPFKLTTAYAVKRATELGVAAHVICTWTKRRKKIERGGASVK
jgi:hypothetical protein